jgi:hypothetical protein
MNNYFVTRKEIARDLGIDTKTLRKRLSEAGFLLKKGLIPAEKVKEIKLRLQVGTQILDNAVINESTKKNFIKY